SRRRRLSVPAFDLVENIEKVFLALAKVLVACALYLVFELLPARLKVLQCVVGRTGTGVGHQDLGIGLRMQTRTKDAQCADGCYKPNRAAHLAPSPTTQTAPIAMAAPQARFPSPSW